jgi:sulfate transport system permease protein
MAELTAPSPRRWREPSILPGFGTALGLVLFWLGLIVLLPMSALAARPWEHGLHGVLKVLADPRTAAALRLSFGTALCAGAANVVFGLIVSWALVRYHFPGRRIADAVVDLPFALPTAVAGIALTTIYAQNGLIGSLLAPLGIKIAYTPLGIFIAQVFVGLPFVVRTVQPVLDDLDAECEEAAATLGAGAWQRWFHVILPSLLPALLTGFGLAFARAVGEYGSVIFIAGNMPLKSEIAPLLIVIKLEQYDYAGAATVGMAMLVAAFAILLTINLIQVFWSRRGA